MYITFNGISIARSSEIATKCLGWSATLPPNLVDSKNKPYDLFNVGLVLSVEWLHSITRYYPN